MGKGMNAVLAGAIIIGMSNFAAGRLLAQSGEVRADYHAPADYPLIKSKFCVYNSGYVRVPHYARDSPLFAEVNPDALRIDLAWGPGGTGWTRQPIAGTAERLTFDWKEMDEIAAMVSKHDMHPLWSSCYMPSPLQSHPREWRSVPISLEDWGKALGAEARHFADKQPAGLGMQHEMYNEPDNHDFFIGSEADYLEVYRHGAQAVRAEDPDAPIVGPALAFTERWIEPFLQFVGENHLPLDTFSFHYYPEAWPKNPSVAEIIAMVSQHLDKHPERATTEMSLNEYNAYRIQYPEGGRQDRFPLAAQLLHNYAAFLSDPALTSVYWAQFMDTGGGNWSGMISYEGHRKAVFNAYSLYSRMPIDRRQVTITGANGVEAMASSDDHTAALLLWNQSGKDQTLNTVLAHLPFTQGTLRIFRIDSDHASWGDNPAHESLEVVETHSLGHADAIWAGAIPKDAVVYLEANDNSGKSALTPYPFAHFIRTFHYYPDRSKSAYADFDRRNWTARLGMVREKAAEATIGVVADELPATVVVTTQVVGHLRRYDANSLLGLRLDYAINGKYVKSVLFHGPCGSQPSLYDKKRNAPMPWGTKRPPDTVVTVPDLARFVITPQTYAPHGWTGRVQITSTLQNTEPHTQAKFILRQGK